MTTHNVMSEAPKVSGNPTGASMPGVQVPSGPQMPGVDMATGKAVSPEQAKAVQDAAEQERSVPPAEEGPVKEPANESIKKEKVWKDGEWQDK